MTFVHSRDETIELVDGSWSETWLLLSTLNGEGLSRASLTIGKDANIVSIDCALNKTVGLLEDLILSGLWSEDAVEVVVVINTCTHGEGHLIIDLDAHLGLGSIFSLGLGEWSDTAVYSDLSLHVLELIQKSLSLTKLLLEFLADSIKSRSLGCVLLLELLLLSSHLLDLLGKLLDVADFQHESLDFLDQLLFLFLLIGEFDLEVVDLCDLILELLVVEVELIVKLLDFLLFCLEFEFALFLELFLVLGHLDLKFLAFLIMGTVLLQDNLLKVIDVFLEGELNLIVLFLGLLDLSLLVSKSHLISLLDSLLLRLQILDSLNLLPDGFRELLNVLLHLVAVLLPFLFLLAMAILLVSGLFSMFGSSIIDVLLKLSHLFCHLLDLVFFHGKLFSCLLQHGFADSVHLDGSFNLVDAHVVATLDDLTGLDAHVGSILDDLTDFGILVFGNLGG